MTEHTPLWKLCEHRIVRGIATLASAILLPVILTFLYWYAATFDEMRTNLVQLNERLPAVQATVADHENRIRHLEAVTRNETPWWER